MMHVVVSLQVQKNCARESALCHFWRSLLFKELAEDLPDVQFALRLASFEAPV